MPLNRNTQVVRVEGLLNEPAGEDLVILNMSKNNYVALDAIGRRIWELLEKLQRVEDLCQELSQEYAATPEQIAADVLPFLEELVEEGLVQVEVSGSRKNEI